MVLLLRRGSHVANDLVQGLERATKGQFGAAILCISAQSLKRLLP